VKQAFSDPYCYPGTSVLRNLLHITDSELLELAEMRIVGLRSDQLFAQLPGAPHDLSQLLLIHHTLFGKLYPFAGQLRVHTGRMTKVRASGYAVVYGDSAFISEQIDLVFRRLAAENYLVNLSPQTFAERTAHFYGELDAVHPFREGNSRTLRLFFSELARTAGYQLDWGILAAEERLREQLFAARDRAVMHGDSGPLATIFASILSSH
jgi:cell filamentation protein